MHSMNKEELSKEIEECFPFLEKPIDSELSFHSEGCHECYFLRTDLEEYAGKELPSDAIRHVHQALTCLSAKGYSWVLPSYLRFCLTDEATYNQMETEFLIYNLGPSEQFQPDTLNRLSRLNQKQINCILHFLEWCNSPEHWAREYCGDEVLSAITFIRKLNA